MLWRRHCLVASAQADTARTPATALASDGAGHDFLPDKIAKAFCLVEGSATLHARYSAN
jgi:hypothetical protein